MNIEHEDLMTQETAQQYETLQELGDCYASVGQYAQAQTCYEKTAILSPDEPGPYVGLGVVALQKNLLDDAEIAFRVASRLDYQCSQAYAGLGMIAQKRGAFETALDMYLKCLDLDTNNLTALLGLFQSSCQMGTFAKVIYYLDVYLQMHPDDESVLFSLAAINMKESRFGQSKKLLQRILVLDSDNKDAADLLEEVERCLHIQGMARERG
jgi:tetratricopeptide (TPR) repeat protein